MRLITNGVFIVQFFNTGILLLLVNANLAEQSSILGSIFTGSSADFNSAWFQQIGNTLIVAIMFNIYWPILEFCSYYIMRITFRLLDRRCKTCNEYSTKTTTIQQYVEIYSGAYFYIHYKYAAILNITFVAFMYGLGIPIMFPIAVISFFVLYLSEKAILYYSYRQPPMYDNVLNNSVLNLLQYAPLLFLAFGYWMYSSHQLFGTEIIPIMKSGDVRQSGHIWYEAFLP